MTIASAERGKFLDARAVGRRLRAIVARFKRPAALKGMSRAEFEQMARDLDLSLPELYGLLTGRNLSAGLVEERLNKLELRVVGAYHGTRTRAFVGGNTGLPADWPVLLLNLLRPQQCFPNLRKTTEP